jgi:hypothetical protein
MHVHECVRVCVCVCVWFLVLESVYRVHLGTIMQWMFGFSTE